MNLSKFGTTNGTSLFVPVCLITISIPVLIFMTTWLNGYCAVLASVLLVISLFIAIKNAPRVWAPGLDKREIIKWSIIIGIIAVWVYFSGIGGYSYQNWDFLYRNITFTDLINKDWPVISSDNGIDVPNSFLVYYIGHWLPAALVGKAFGLEAGNFALYVWSVFMIVLTYYLVCVIFRKTLIWPLFVFIFFSGMDIIGYAITRMAMGGVLDMWSHVGQFSSLTTQLYWVFNQTIAAWLVTLLLFAVRIRRSYVFLSALLLLFAPLPVIGLVPIVGVLCFYDTIDGQCYCKKMNIKSLVNKVIKPLISFENIIGAGSIAIVMILYYKANSSGHVVIPIPPLFEIWEYFLFLLAECLILFFFVYKAGQRSLLLIVSVLYLCICPFVMEETSGNGDFVFCMRTSIPALIVLYVYTVKALQNPGKKYIFILMISVLSCGAITPLSEVKRTLTYTFIKREYKNRVKDNAYKSALCQPPYTKHFSGSQDSFFYRHLARKNLTKTQNIQDKQ